MSVNKEMPAGLYKQFFPISYKPFIFAGQVDEKHDL